MLSAVELLIFGSLFFYFLYLLNKKLNDKAEKKDELEPLNLDDLPACVNCQSHLYQHRSHRCTRKNNDRTLVTGTADNFYKFCDLERCVDLRVFPNFPQCGIQGRYFINKVEEGTDEQQNI